MNERALNINELLYSLKKRFKLIIMCVLICTLFAGVYATFKMYPIYTASIKIFAGKDEQIQGNYSSNELDSYKTLINSYIEILKTDDFMNKVIKKGNLNMTSGQLMGGLSFTTAQNAPILTISYTAGDPETAEKVVSTLSSEFEVGVKEIILNTYTKIIDSVKVIEILPAKIKVVFVGFMAGLLMGVGLVFIIDYLDDTVVKREELEKVLPIPVLAELPIENYGISKNDKNSKNKKARKVRVKLGGIKC